MFPPTREPPLRLGGATSSCRQTTAAPAWALCHNLHILLSDGIECPLAKPPASLRGGMTSTEWCSRAGPLCPGHVTMGVDEDGQLAGVRACCTPGGTEKPRQLLPITVLFFFSFLAPSLPLGPARSATYDIPIVTCGTRPVTFL